MEEGIQKASIAKRISAGLLDFIAVTIIATLCAWIISISTDYDGWNKKLEDSYAHYESQYGVAFRITEEEYFSKSKAEREQYDTAYKALISDNDAMKAYNMVSNLMVLTVSIGLFIAFLIWEFIIPLFLKDGRTVGSLIFGIAVMRSNGVRVSHISLFIRAILGKYVIETMIPVYLVLMILMNTIGIVGPLVIAGILILEICLIIGTRNNQLIHCILSDTIVVDYASQMIFDSDEALLEHKKRVARERVARDPYYK
ncbi:MAG: hypothetical protein ACI4SL_03935 [Candidatus Ornithospirochaeta sp.]